MDSFFVSENIADVSREKLATVYAQALAGASAEQQIDLTDLLDEYGSFVREALDAYPKFAEILGSPMVSGKEKERMLDALSGNASEVFRSFLRTVARRDRLELLRDIYQQFRRIEIAAKNRIPVQITTAAAFDEAFRSSLVERLIAVVGGEPVLETVVDPDVIGGVIVRVGDTVFDASIATQLDNVRQQMIDRSAHEIQSRRNSFRNSEGN